MAGDVAGQRGNVKVSQSSGVEWIARHAPGLPNSGPRAQRVSCRVRFRGLTSRRVLRKMKACLVAASWQHPAEPPAPLPGRLCECASSCVGRKQAPSWSARRKQLVLLEKGVVAKRDYDRRSKGCRRCFSRTLSPSARQEVCR